MSQERTMPIISVPFPQLWLDDMERMVQERGYRNRCELIRMAVREVLRQELWSKQRIQQEEAPKPPRPLTRILVHVNPKWLQKIDFYLENGVRLFRTRSQAFELGLEYLFKELEFRRANHD